MSSSMWIAMAAAVVVFIFVQRLRSRVGSEQAEKIREALEQGARLVDVRSVAEFSGGHQNGAINIPVSELAGRTRELGSRKKPVVLYCATGSRSSQAVRFLASQGYEQVLDLKTLRNGGLVQRAAS